jgi:hypothetical protein
VTAVLATVRTERVVEWATLLTSIGLRRDDSGRWFTGDGVVALDYSDQGEDIALSILVPSVSDATATLSAAGIVTTMEHDTRVAVRPASGPPIELAPAVTESATDPLRVMPIWYAPELSEARTILDALALRETIRADSGVWIEFEAPTGGIVALHSDPQPRVELAFSYRGNLDVLRDEIRRSGFTADVVDEAYNRTVHVQTPSGAALHINGPIDDLYGFHRVD